MLVKRFIQNYFEVNGSFNNIELTAVADWLRNTAKSEGITIKELCFRMLGFAFSDTISAEQCYELSILAARGDRSTLCKFFNCKTVQEIKEHLKPYDILYLNVIDKTKLTNIEQQCLDVLYNYYRYCSRASVEIEKTRYTVSQGLPFLRHYFKNVNEIYKMLSSQGALVTLHKTDSLSIKIENNCLFTSYDIDINKLNKLAIQFVFCGYRLSYNILLTKNDKLAMISLSNPDTYLNLLGVAGACNITFKQLMSYADIHVEDQTDLFNAYGLIAQVYDGLVYYTDSTSTDTKPFYLTNIDAFEMKLHAMAGGCKG